MLITQFLLVSALVGYFPDYPYKINISTKIPNREKLLVEFANEYWPAHMLLTINLTCQANTISKPEFDQCAANEVRIRSGARQ